MKYFIHLPMKMELIEGSETSAISVVTPGNYPKENILHTEHGESLKPRIQSFLTVALLLGYGVSHSVCNETTGDATQWYFKEKMPPGSEECSLVKINR